MSKSGVRKGKDFMKNMEKLKKIYGGKIPKNLSIDEADKVLKKVTPIKRKKGGKATKERVSPMGSDSTVEGALSELNRMLDKKAPDLTKAEKIKLKAYKAKRFMQSLGGFKAPMRKYKSGGVSKKKKKDPLTSRYQKIRNTILAAPEAVEIGKEILQSLPMKKGGMKRLKPIPPENKGLRKLPRPVRNKMGYMKKGGSTTAKCKLGRNKPTKLL
jgi:hypothetical protein